MRHVKQGKYFYTQDKEHERTPYEAKYCYSLIWWLYARNFSGTPGSKQVDVMGGFCELL